MPDDVASSPAPDRRLAAWRRLGMAGVVAALVVLTNLLVWAVVYRAAHPPDWQGRVGGLAFSPFQRDQSPLLARFPQPAQVRDDIAIVARYTARIRSYASQDIDAIPAAAREAGLDVLAGAWLDRRRPNNARELDALIEAAAHNPNVSRAIVGNEVLLRGDLNPRQLIAYLDRARRELRIPVSTAEPWHLWLRHPELAEHVDFITIHLLPYWEGVTRRSALELALRHYAHVVRRFPDKHVVIGEIGWPSNGDRYRNAVASREDQARFVREFVLEADRRGYDYYLMEAFDQPWKIDGEGRVGAYWGIFDAARQLKFPLAGPVEEDPDWRDKALLSSAAALLPILAFSWTFARFALRGRLFFCALLQACAAMLVWSISLPLDFYLDWLDWVMLSVLLPAQLAIVAALLINGFEFTEALSQRHWQRRFLPLAALPPRPPMISVHVPCHSEPPDMVMQTLDGLAALDYPAFEVLVIDNNTADPAIWRPVQAHCAALGARFRFFHLEDWPGFKAGALNHALAQTAPDARIVALVDSDYVVRSDWLRGLAGYFEDPRIGIVQAPQAHRDWQHSRFRRITNWEYDGFFRIGMHHRNERDAIIQHGTMTLIRRDVLDRLRWSQWCICEDAELGLRVMQAGYTTVYVDEIYGRGVTPADFTAYKTQRFRWVFGAMQILRRHLGALLRGHRLSVGQRYHFLTGWFSWFADALHLAFSLLAVGWSVGMLAAPQLFALPHPLFLIPVLGLFVAKAVFGIVLYRARVRCGWSDTLGAALASMALSHTIARGVFQGLVATSHPFMRTAKRRRLRTRPRMFRAIREELALLALLLSSTVGMAAVPGANQLEGQLWTLILLAQAIPYAAALACALISARATTISPDGRGTRPARSAAAILVPGHREPIG